MRADRHMKATEASISDGRPGHALEEFGTKAHNNALSQFVMRASNEGFSSNNEFQGGVRKIISDLSKLVMVLLRVSIVSPR
jgi:hypothetical protein